MVVEEIATATVIDLTRKESECVPGVGRDRGAAAHRRAGGHSTVDTTVGYAAIYPEDVIAHHRAFISHRRAERPSEEYRDLTNQEWDKFLAHFELRKVALGTCGRDHGTPGAAERKLEAMRQGRAKDTCNHHSRRTVGPRYGD